MRRGAAHGTCSFSSGTSVPVRAYRSRPAVPQISAPGTSDQAAADRFLLHSLQSARIEAAAIAGPWKGVDACLGVLCLELGLFSFSLRIHHEHDGQRPCPGGPESRPLSPLTRLRLIVSCRVFSKARGSKPRPSPVHG